MENTCNMYDISNNQQISIKIKVDVRRFIETNNYYLQKSLMTKKFCMFMPVFTEGAIHPFSYPISTLARY